MMLIFQEIIDDLPPFEKYWTHMLQNKSMRFVGDLNSKVLPLTILHNDLF